jgi:beta-galactosidase
VPVVLTPEGLQVEGKLVPVYAGAVHYWRLEKALWPKILDQVKGLGFGMIETYIPWSVHETSPGHYDWGQEYECKDVEAFMELCEDKGLWLMVRPGPLINAELTHFGFPEWVLLDPAVQARTSAGSLHLDAASGLHPPHQFPVPSYASEAFYQATGTWFDAVCPIIARHLAPDGCVVAVQSDNETCYMFHDQPYATDYSASSIDLYHKFLTERYDSLTLLNGAYHSHYTSFAEIDPPRDCTIENRDDVRWHLDWVAYKEYQIIYSVSRFARMLRERGILGVPIFHDIAYQYRTPLDVIAMEADPHIDWVGMNQYRNKEDFAWVRRQGRYLAGSTRTPFIPEFGCGIWSHHPQTPMPDDEEFIGLTTLMYGVKAFSLYMLVERERWQGCPITRHGTLRQEYAPFYQRLTAFLQDNEFWKFQRKPKVLVLFNYDLDRYNALTSTLNYSHIDLLDLPPALSEVDPDLGLEWSPRAEGEFGASSNWFHTVTQSLQVHHIDYNLSDTHLDLERLQDYPVVFLPTVDFLDREAQTRLLDYVRGGGMLVMGPGMPDLDPAMQPCRILAEHLTAPGAVIVGNGQLVWCDTDRLAEMIPLVTPPPAFDCDQSVIDLCLHSNGQRNLLFVANPTAAPVNARLIFTGTTTLNSIWGEKQTCTGKRSIPLTIPPYTVQIWEAMNDKSPLECHRP